MKEYMRYALGVLAVIFVVVLFVLGFNLIKGALNNNDKNNNQKNNTAPKQVNLTDKEYANQPVVYTVRGAINSNEDHYATRIIVTPTYRRAEVVRGYSNVVVKSQQTPNTQEAYNAFIEALNGAGFTKKTTEQTADKENQSCSLGRRFNYEINPGVSNSFYTWSTSCSGKQGNFGGNRQMVERLFERQIPKYDEFTRGVQLN